MPCNCDYMEPTTREIRSKETAILLRYVNSKIGAPEDATAKEVAESYYGNVTKLDYLVVTLCKTLSEMDEATLNAVVYNAKDKTSRELANWWEEHLEADSKRIRVEADRVLSVNRSDAKEELLDRLKETLSDYEIKLLTSE